MGLSLGASEGLVVGDLVNDVGTALTLGAPVGDSDGWCVGTLDGGSLVPCPVGLSVGIDVGDCD